MPCVWCCCFRKERRRNENNNSEKPPQKDLTKEELPLRNSTIEELKSKLGAKDIGAVTATMIPEGQRAPPHHTAPPLLNEDGLIIPRKPPNPVKENTDRQSLHRELLFNQKIGKNVLNQKSELQRALEKHKDNVAKKELVHHVADNTPELEKVIADRAKRLQATEEKSDDDDKVINKEFLQARMKLKNRSDSK